MVVAFALNAQAKPILRERSTLFLEIITCDPSIYTMDHPDFIACSFMENCVGLKRVKYLVQKLLTII